LKRLAEVRTQVLYRRPLVNHRRYMSRRLLDSIAFYCSARPKSYFFSATISVLRLSETTPTSAKELQTALALMSQLAIGHLLASVFKSQDGVDGAQRPVCESSDTPVHIIDVAVNNSSLACRIKRFTSQDSVLFILTCMSSLPVRRRCFACVSRS
jgi:hypothetical protein